MKKNQLNVHKKFSTFEIIVMLIISYLIINLIYVKVFANDNKKGCSGKGCSCIGCSGSGAKINIEKLIELDKNALQKIKQFKVLDK